MSNKNHPVLKKHRKKVWAAFISLLIAAVMIVTATFAWLTLSTAPEVVGVTTNVGANGSLEIALLNTATRNDLSAIITGVGTSSEAVGTIASNVTWGNIVDLSDSYYGLDQIKLLPAQFLVEQSNTSVTGYSVNPNGPLGMPTYGTDGRIVRIDTNAVSAIYSSNKFGLSENQTYGVRGLGTSSGTTSGATLLSLAKSYISTYAGSAKITAINTLNSNGTGLVNILLTHSASDSATFGDSDIAVLKSIITDLLTSYGHVETAIRYGMLANVIQAGADASVASDIRDTTKDVSTLYATYAENCPADMGTWVSKLASGKATLNGAYNACAALTGNAYAWSDIQPILESLINLSHVYVDDVLFSELDATTLMASTGFTMSLVPGSGVFSDLAAFTGDYSTWLSLLGKQVEFKARTDANPTYLTALDNTIDTSSQGEVSLDSLEIDNLGGYAIDLAFRCNAADSDLQLQIAPEQRVYTDSTSSDLQGAGSYMQFSNNDGSLTTGQMIELMDAIRVTFVDINGDILAMAKLNTSNRSFEDNGDIKASLYLYNYSVVAEDGVSKIKIGERRTGDVKITELDQNVAKAVTAIVWIDGNIVDNSMVSAVSDSSLNGILNLQFSSSVDLVPAENGTLYNSNASRLDLTNQLNDSVENYPVKATYERGQQGSGYELVYNAETGNYEESDTEAKWNYTNNSWNAFETAYIYAEAVLNNQKSSATQIKSAYNNLKKAYDGLVEVSHAALIDLIHEVRELTGTTTEVAGYITNDGCLLTEYTQEEKDLKAANTPVYMINPENNLHDEGNGVQTPVYTEQSWKKLAIALYDAEAANAYADANDDQITAAYTALELACNMLERGVYYDAYELNGVIYYRAITSETDTYGKWYDADFKRVISDLKILDLDSTAVPAKVAVIEAPDYYEIGSGEGVAATIDLNKNAYPKFKNDEVIGIRWALTGLEIDDINRDSVYVLNSLIAEATTVKSNEAVTNGNALDGLITEAQTTIAKIDAKDEELTPDEIAQLINDFSEAVASAKVEIAEDAEEKAAQAESERTKVNADEKTVLAAAILEAKRIASEREINITLNVEATENASNPNLGFIKAVQDAQTVQDKEYNAEITEYNDKLAALNAKITAYGGTAQTAYNVIVHKVEHSSEYTEGINRIALPITVIDPDEEHYASTKLTARILTKNGVVYTAEKTVLFYNKADKIEISNSTDKSYTFNVINKHNYEDNEIYCNETPIEYVWSISDTVHYKLTNADKATCTVTPQDGASGATLTLTVKMDTGSEYTASKTIGD